jgi:hypothetical protein
MLPGFDKTLDQIFRMTLWVMYKFTMLVITIIRHLLSWRRPIA